MNKKILMQNNKGKDNLEVKVIEKKSNHTIMITKYEKPNSRKEMNTKVYINITPNENEKEKENIIQKKENKGNDKYYSVKSTLNISKQNYIHNSQGEKEAETEKQKSNLIKYGLGTDKVCIKKEENMNTNKRTNNIYISKYSKVDKNEKNENKLNIGNNYQYYNKYKIDNNKYSSSNNNKDINKENNKENESAKPNPIIENIKSKYILSKIYDFISKKKKLEIVRYNKRIQKRLNLSIKDYFEEFSKIEIEIIPTKDKYGKFINIINKYDKKYYHIYFNVNKEETKNKYEINKEDKVTKIIIIIDYQIKSFKKLFDECECIEYINFKKFYRNNIIDMSRMFSDCSSLKELNLTNFNTNNVKDMSFMFPGCWVLEKLNLTNFNTNDVTNMRCMFSNCSSLKELNLTNFNTNNVEDMGCMFSNCSSLEELILYNFNTKNVTNMCFMFYRCRSLKELNLTNFNTKNVTSMEEMFRDCSSLKELNLSNFNTKNVTNMCLMFSGCWRLEKLNLTNFKPKGNITFMFSGCSDYLKRKIKSENKNFKDYSFDDYSSDSSDD